jgi:hypothetical protein
MDIYIIHEYDIVKFIYGKNILSHIDLKLNGFSLTVLGSLLAVGRRTVFGKALARLWRALSSDRVRGQLDGVRLQA